MVWNIQDVLTTLERISNEVSDEVTKNEIIDCVNLIKETLGNIRKVNDLKTNISNALDAIQSASSYMDDAENYLEKL